MATKVTATTEYKACSDRHPNLESLIREALKNILSDVNNFESHDYVIKND